MNILEHYIEEVMSVEPYNEDWIKEFDKEYVRVYVKTNCYGCVEDREWVGTVDDWEINKERGYFMW